MHTKASYFHSPLQFFHTPTHTLIYRQRVIPIIGIKSVRPWASCPTRTSTSAEYDRNILFSLRNYPLEENISTLFGRSKTIWLMMLQQNYSSQSFLLLSQILSTLVGTYQVPRISKSVPFFPNKKYICLVSLVKFTIGPICIIPLVCTKFQGTCTYWACGFWNSTHKKSWLKIKNDYILATNYFSYTMGKYVQVTLPDGDCNSYMLSYF